MKKMNFYSFTLMCLGMIFFIGCTQDPGSNPNAFRLEDGPNGIAGGSRYGYLGADQVKEIPNQNTNTQQNATVYLDPSNTPTTSKDNKDQPKKTDKINPNAASSFKRVFRVISIINKAPNQPATIAPNNNIKVCFE